jgi:hypothetical protein
MIKRILTISMAVALILVLALPMAVGAANTVTCTVTGELVSVAVTDGSVAYGTLALGASADTLAGDHQTATNNGTINEDFDIKSSNAIGAVSWTLADTAGSNQYFHDFSVDPGPPRAWIHMANTDQELASDVAPAGSQVFDLRIGMPTSTSDYTQHTITVTITATAS